MLIQNFITGLTASLFNPSKSKKQNREKWLSKFWYYAILGVIAIAIMTICVTAQVLISDKLNRDFSELGMAIGAGLTIGITGAAAKRLKGCIKE